MAVNTIAREDNVINHEKELWKKHREYVHTEQIALDTDSADGTHVSTGMGTIGTDCSIDMWTNKTHKTTPDTFP
jgi:hypothetical protein